jgi:hypothetical protein
MLGTRIWTSAAIAVAIFIGYKLVVAHADRHRSLRRADDVVSFVSTTLPRRRRWRPTFPAFLRLTFWSGVIAGILLLSGLVGLSGTTTAGTAATATFTATEDTFLKESRPTRVHGQAASLQADNYPSVKRVLVRFQVSGIPRGASITSATLRMFVVDASREAGEVLAVGGGWSEATTTWSNAPAVAVKIADLTDPAQAGTWREADVTAAVTGNSDVDFYIVTPYPDGVDYQSTEGGPNPSTLVVQWSAAPSPTTSTPTPTSTPRVTPTSTSLPTPTPAPTPTPDPSFQPQPPIAAAFFYPWFPSAWNQAGVYPYTNYTPSLGLYDSQDDAVIDEQLRLAAGAHIEAFISSWWGQGHHTDAAFEHILGRSERLDSPYRNLRWAIYYEDESQGDPAVSQIVTDLQYLASNYFQHSGYLKVNGSPVVFVYANAADACGMADRWVQAKTQFGGNVYIVLKVFSGYRNCASQPDSWHQYAPAMAYDSQLPYSVTVSPGFWKVGEQPRLVRDSARFESDVQRMAVSGAFWQLVTAWNEWGEGTSVEPATEFGTTYQDSLCRNLPGRTACSSGPTPTATPTRTPTPTSTPTRTPIPPPPGTDPLLVGASDIGSKSGDGDEHTAQLLDAIFAGSPPGGIFTAGDNVNEEPVNLVDYTTYFESTWGRHKALIRPAAGNHDYLDTAGVAQGYFDYFDGVGNNNGPAGERGKGYYSYDLGAWHIVVINSNCSKVGGCGAGSPQEQWLRADLAAHPAACTAAYWHHPRFSSGQHGGFSSMQPIWQALYDYGAEVVFNGHNHVYERFAPQNPNGNADPNGIREFVVGTGGKNHYPFPTGPLANEEVRNNDTFGVLKLTLHPTSYDWEFVPEAGKTFTDSGSQACH